MKILRESSRWFRVVLALGILVMPVSAADAQEAVLPVLRDASQALVRVQSVQPLRSFDQQVKTVEKTDSGFLITTQTRSMNRTRGGNGIIIDPKGIIVTNDHIVRDAAQISVILSNGTTLSVREVFLVPDTDIAFLMIAPPFALDYIPLENSDRIMVGTKVYTIGRSLGHQGMILEGKVNGLFRKPTRQKQYPDFLQVVFNRSFLYQGDSGCPLLNRRGYLVGMVSAGRRDTARRETLAIPSNMIRDAYWNIPKS